MEEGILLLTRKQKNCIVTEIKNILISTHPQYGKFNLTRVWRLSRVYGTFAQVRILSEYLVTNDVAQNVV